MSENEQVIAIIKKLYANKRQCVDHLADGTDAIPNVMGTGPRNQRELTAIKIDGYNAINAAEADSHRFSYNNLGYAKNAINNAKRDIQDIKKSQTAKASSHYQADVQFDKDQIKRDEKFPSDELILISRLNNGKIVRPAKPSDIEMIYHNTHNSEREIMSRHPNELYYTSKDAETDAKQDLG